MFEFGRGIRKRICLTTIQPTEVVTLRETRLAITLLNADKMPAQMGISISQTPKTSSDWMSASSLSLNGSMELS